MDEISISEGKPRSLLESIQSQLDGWLGQTQVVLSCRTNVWNVNLLLDEFKTYRPLPFSYGDSTTPNQIGRFITKWFKQEPQLGQKLKQKLNKLGNERIKDLVKNPLRLALLCSTWNRWREHGGLPDPKAKLYKGYVEKFYEWKAKEFPTTASEQREFNQVLGKLAQQAIEQSNFRLSHSLVCDILGQPEGYLFQRLVEQLNWLIKVGEAEENPDEQVYAFFHPTFQEYFAAQSINSWHFFLNHDNKKINPLLDPNPSLEHNGGKPEYRIFDSQWKEVILLWLGQPEEKVAKEQKKEFISALLDFDDGLKGFGFYTYPAYFLAAAGIKEFTNFR